MNRPDLPSTLQAIGVAVGRGPRRLLHGVDIVLPPGRLLLLCGPNGAGKSTLLEVLAGQRQPADGRVQLDGQPIGNWPRWQRAQRLGLLPQDEAPGYEGRVDEFVALGRLPWVRGRTGAPQGTGGPADDAVVEEELEAFGLRGVARTPLRELSGGQRQRARLAQLFAQRARVLLLDEPATHLDPAHQWRLQQRLAAHCARDGGAALAVVHPSGWPLTADQPLALVMPDGRLAAGAARALVEDGRAEQALGCRLRRYREADAEVWLAG